MFWHGFAKIPRHTRQKAITEGDLECILPCNCEGTEQLQADKSSRIIPIWRERMEFNREQQQAMEHKDGPMLVLAGPGSGKTEVIIRRTRKLIQDYQVAPSSVLRPPW